MSYCDRSPLFLSRDQQTEQYCTRKHEKKEEKILSSMVSLLEIKFNDFCTFVSTVRTVYVSSDRIHVTLWLSHLNYMASREFGVCFCFNSSGCTSWWQTEWFRVRNVPSRNWIFCTRRSDISVLERARVRSQVNSNGLKSTQKREREQEQGQQRWEQTEGNESCL